MSATDPLSGVRVAKAVCLTQLLITAVAGALALWFWGEPQAVSALYGGAIAVVPTAYFAIRVFARGRHPQTPADVVGAAFRGEIGKFAMTAVMFGIGVRLFAAHFLALLATYIACLMAYWVVLASAGFSGTDRTY